MGGSLGFPELLLILGIAFIVFVVFGPKNLPKLGKMFGSTMAEVRKGMNEVNDGLETPAEQGVAVPAENVVIYPDQPAPAAAPVQQVVAAPTPEAVEVITPVQAAAEPAQVVYEAQPSVVNDLEIDPNRKVAKIVYEDEVDA